MSNATSEALIYTLENLAIPEPDAEFLAGYLAEIKERSDGNIKHPITLIPIFYKCVGFKSVQDITNVDVKAFNAFLDDYIINNTTGPKTKNGQKLKESVKSQYFGIIKAWLKVAATCFIERDIEVKLHLDLLKNPYTGKGTKKAPTSLKVELEMDEKKGIKSFSDDDLETIMRASKLEEKWVQILFLILKYTGMRLSEAISLRRENIDLKERVLASGVVKNYRKTGEVIFCVPEHVITEIKEYYMLMNDGQEWLFPSRYNTGSFVTEDGFYRICHVIAKKCGIHFTPHQFRHTLIKNRDIKMHCPDHVNEFLQNHAVTGVQARYYRERNFTLRDRRDFYDQFNPYD
jgi:integrase